MSSENTLMINAPLVCDDTLQTNDIARIYPDGSFTILGRKDNVINSGGIKVQAEEIEKVTSVVYPCTVCDHFRSGSAFGAGCYFIDRRADGDKCARD